MSAPHGSRGDAENQRRPGTGGHIAGTRTSCESGENETIQESWSHMTNYCSVQNSTTVTVAFPTRLLQPVTKPTKCCQMKQPSSYYLFTARAVECQVTEEQRSVFKDTERLTDGVMSAEDQIGDRTSRAVVPSTYLLDILYMHSSNSQTGAVLPAT